MQEENSAEGNIGFQGGVGEVEVAGIQTGGDGRAVRRYTAGSILTPERSSSAIS